MAITKVLSSTTLSIEAQSGVDKDGAPVYKKKNISNVKGAATPDAISAVADAIKLVLANPTRNTFVNEISALEDNA